MAFVERLKIILDMEGDNAKKGLRSIGKEISAADGLTNKLKAGWAGASKSIQANAGALAVTAGASIIAFGVKAVHAFEQTAKAAVDLGKATGLSTEQASRWIAVADDYGVSASNLASALGKMGKNLDAAAMEKYGIQTRDAAGNARDANEIFMDVLETLNNTAPAERAKVGTELLGKGWQGISPILGKTRAEYEKMLGSVERGQVITEKEAKKAERMRLAEDALADALNEATLAVGGFVASMSPMIENVASGVETVSELTQEFELMQKAAAAVDYTNPVTAIQRLNEAVTQTESDLSEVGLEEFTRLLLESGKSVEDLTPLMERWIAANGDTGLSLDELKTKIFGTAAAASDSTGAIGGFSTVLGWVSDIASATAGRVDGLTRAQERTRKATEKTTAAYEFQMGLLDASDSYHEIALTLSDVEDQIKANDEAVKDGSMTWEEAMHANAIVLNDAKQEVMKYGEEILKLPPEKLTEVMALIDAGEYAKALALIEELSKPRTVRIGVNTTVNSSGGNTGQLSGNIGQLGGNGIEAVGGTRGASVVINNTFNGVTNARELVDLMWAAAKDGMTLPPGGSR